MFIHETTCNEQNSEICTKYAHTTTFQVMAEADVMRGETVDLTHIDEIFNPIVYSDVNKAGLGGGGRYGY